MLPQVARVAGRVVLALAVLYGVLVGLGLLLTRVFDKSAFLQNEEELNEALADSRTQTLNDLTYVFSGLGNTGAIIGALVVVAIGLRVATKRWAPSLFLMTAVSAQALVFLLVTLTIDRQRPDVKQLDDSPPTSSFPSGHTGASLALFVGSALLVWLYVRRRWVKILLLVVLVAAPVLVAYARLYRGMHHPSDVIGSLVNAGGSITIAARNILWPARGGDPAPDPGPAPAPTTPAGATTNT